ncbi:Exportin-T [Caenorhabditis elegans]|uniref:Exportin-T n=2 Tax=Caenorhabditis elegans TaxID=6239 RepID=W6RQY2_CAEEL|nr:Exportin-T [Caenorhabditis elegans]CDM63499.1 Exportin-T [Caenorhabditis elegans]|eukprot:NP_001294153.1 eXPOrtin (nuclear export receptor) [Caenorhabditis elegans]
MFGTNGNAGIAVTDPTKQAEIYRALESLKKDESGWKKSVDSFIGPHKPSPEEQFLLLQVIEDYLNKRYHSSSQGDVSVIRTFLLHYTKNSRSSTVDQPAFLTNKMAHIFSLVFAADFPERWSSFFNDLFSFFSDNINDRKVAFFYLKVLLAIDTEVVNRDIQRSKNESDRNIKIKDAMREICINEIAKSWLTIANALPEDNVIQCLVLDNIASYVDWIELDLVANDYVMPLIISKFQNPATSESATAAVCSLLEKGMPAEKKVGLTLTIMTVLRSNGLLTVNDNNDEEEVTRVGSLVNTLGLVLLDVQNKLCASSILEKEQECCVQEMAGLAEPALVVLNNEDPDLSCMCIDYIRAYCSFLLKFHPNETNFIEKVIRAGLQRYVMNDDMTVGGDGEDEVEFQEFRRELRSMLNVIGLKRPEAIINAVEPWTAEVTSGGSSIPVNRIEALLNVIFHLHEIIPSNMLQSPREGISQRAARLPIVILEGLVLDGRCPAIHVLYFELACRYERLLVLQPQPVVIPHIAAAFLDQRGISISSANVRTRIVYLFCRFVKSHKTVLGPLVSEVITRLAPLLAVSPQADTNQLLSPEDQGYIFEATATLIVFGDLTSEMKSQYVGELASTLAMKFENGLVELNTARARKADEETIQAILQFMSNIIGYSSRMSKAFNNAQSMKACNCIDIYLRLIKLYLETLSPQNAFLLESTRQFAHRLVVSMENELMPYMNGIFDKLALVSTDLDSMHHLLIFCHQTVAKYKKAMLTSGVDLGNVLAIAARASLQEQENNIPAKDDSQRALLYVQRAFVQLLYTVIASDCTPALNTTPGLLDHVLESAARLALSSDQTAQKVALSCLAKISLITPSWSARTLRVALEIPSLSHITPSDAGSTLVVHEVCATLTSLHQSDPDGFTRALRELVPNGFSDQLLSALTNLKGKNLDKQVMNLYSSLRNQSAQ